ncbi:chemotaxis protein CheW [Reichenbachiella versicolor]|uniref:chemotaxis protein CheW n=1 Tax=Reichenbachiella versicolor TaxID=1821036 RepID=UPI000D6E3CF7|nr:chemotaxis protein CheW [Reichenbachiella versicolor]
MPIGKNLKKDTLIPSGKKVKATKAVTKKKTTLKKKTPEATQEIAEQIEEKVVQSLEVSDAEKQVIDEGAQIRKQISSGEYITEKEYQERQRLQAKFDDEILSYKGKELQLVTFTIGDERYAIDIDAIKEVVPIPQIAKIPHAPLFIKGVANIRGVIMVIIDLDYKFKYKTEKEDSAVLANKEGVYTVVIKGSIFNAAIIVNEVPTTLKVSGDNMVSSAGLLGHTALDETYIKGLIKTDIGMVIYLDIKELIEDNDVKVMSQTIAQLK